MKINTVTVIGANGAMGYNVAGIFAAFGKCKVYLVCRAMEAAKEARKRAMFSVKGEAIGEYLEARTYADLQECIEDSDLIFESVVENMQIKSEINQKINLYINDNQIVCTGTSGLSIAALSEHLSKNRRRNYMGLHFFNPPYNMILCEIIPSAYTDRECLKNVKNYAENILNRTVVEVKDSPAFLGNRIGFQFINEAIQYAEKYKYNGGIDYIDAILGQFTGRNMAPILTADFVGLDVHKAIVDNIYASTRDYARDTFRLPEFLDKMIEQGNLGRKTKKGLYQTVVRDDGTKDYYVYDILTGEYRKKNIYHFRFAEDMIGLFRVGNYCSAFNGFKKNESTEAKLCMEFLLKYILYSLTATELVGDDIMAADDVMATGFNWIPPLALIQALGGEEEVKKLCKEKLDKEFLQDLEVDRVLRGIPKSKYDYRKYFKAKH